MPLTHESAERLFQSGEFNQLLATADLTERGVRAMDLPLQAILAHALAQTGNVPLARRLAASVNQPNTPPSLRSRVCVALGIADENDGEMSAALEHFQTALRFAHAAKDDQQIAWAQLRLFRHVIDTCPNEVITAMLPEARRAATRAGNTQVSAFLHQCLAVLEGQSGRLNEALRHSDVSDSLLVSTPNAWLASGNVVNRICVAILNCDFRQAAKYVNDARPDVRRSGTRFRAADQNLAYFQIHTGQFQKAINTLTAISDSPGAPRMRVLGVFDAFAKVYLALGRLEECGAALNVLDQEMARDPSLFHRFAWRWSAVTKARFLMKSRRPAEAYEFIASIRDQSSAVDDNPLKALLHLTAAQAAHGCGRPFEAARALICANRLGIIRHRELQAQYYFGSGLVVEGSFPPLSALNKERARRLWKEQGIVSLAFEMDPGLTQTAPTGEPTKRSSAVAAIDRIAAALDLAHTPRLLGNELLSIIQSTECSDRAEIVERKPGTPTTEDSDTVAIALGRHRHFDVTLICSMPATPERAMVLGSVMRIADAALMLERAREEERRKAAFWPAEPVEHQAGALFIADEMQSLLTTARRVAATNVSVLITGETGTGKEVLARTIHAYSNRAKHPFLPFNCTSTPRDMLDSQLFGHRRGSFTGATEHFPGVIRTAAGGTLFLDEIGDMPLDVQPKLLRFLESGEVHPIGEAQPVRADARVIAATNASLDALVGDGRFREDLFYRLNIVRLHVPPLRERRVEIPTLANHYLHKYAQEYGKGDLRLAEETMEYLVLYRWPGNVRQLANEMRRMTALCESGAVLMPEHLSAEIAASRRTIPASERVLDVNEVVVRLDQPLAAATEHLERAMLKYALDKTGGRIEEAATLLGLSRKGLYLKRQRFGIEPPGEPLVAGVA